MNDDLLDMILTRMEKKGHVKAVDGYWKPTEKGKKEILGTQIMTSKSKPLILTCPSCRVGCYFYPPEDKPPYKCPDCDQRLEANDGEIYSNIARLEDIGNYLLIEHKRKHLDLLRRTYIHLQKQMIELKNQRKKLASKCYTWEADRTIKKWDKDLKEMKKKIDMLEDLLDEKWPTM